MHISTGEANSIPLGALEALEKDGEECNDTICGKSGVTMDNGRLW